MLSDGVAAILGPATPHIAQYVESILDHKEVPHLTGRWDDRQTVGSFQVNLYPYPAMLQEVHETREGVDREALMSFWTRTEELILWHGNLHTEYFLHARESFTKVFYLYFNLT